MLQPSRARRARAGLLAGVLCLATALSGCGHFRHGDSDAAGKPAATASAGSPLLSLQGAKLAVLMPTAAASQEEDRQALAEIFTQTLRKSRPDLSTVPLTDTLSAISAAGLAGRYDQLYVAYKNTGLFDRHALQQIARAPGARYLIQLKLGSYDQSSSGGLFSFLGLSLGHKQTADLRLTLQVWDGTDGRIVWERSTEKSETKRFFIVGRSVKMADVETAAAEDLVKQLPR